MGRRANQVAAQVSSSREATDGYQFSRVFRVCLERLGMKAAQFGTHSFRIGAATEAARAGLAGEVIQRIGRWESKRYRSYVRPLLAGAERVSPV
ncbi:hypothetical protein FKM82_008176 [Ascaphus truei]